MTETGAQDVTKMDPTKYLVMAITGSGKPGETGYIPGAGTTGAMQTIADSESLANTGDMLTDVTASYMGTPDDPMPGDAAPDPKGWMNPATKKYQPYTKQQIMKRETEWAKKMNGKDVTSDQLKQWQTYLNQWSAQSSINDTMLQIPTGQFNNMSKSLQSSVQQDQSNLDQIKDLGSTAVGNKSYANNLYNK